MTSRLPLYARITFYLLNICLIVVVMYFGQDILIPLCFAILFSLMLLPLSKALEHIKVPRIFAVVLTLLIVLSLIVGLIILLARQFMGFTDSFPLFISKFNHAFRDIQHFSRQQLGISILGKYKNAQTGLTEMLNSGGSIVSSTLSLTTGFFVNVGMVVVYCFFFLLYRNSFSQFVYHLFPAKSEKRLSTLITKIKKLVQSYILGILSVVSIIATLNSVGLYFIGIDNPVFLGTVAGLFAIIPYIGVFIGGALPVLVAFITKDSLIYPLGVMGMIVMVHFLEGNIITPYFVGRRVSINPLTAIVGIIMGELLWGVSGMILSLPIIAVIKSIFDSVDSLKPYGYMLGLEISDDKPDLNALYKKFKLDDN